MEAHGDERLWLPAAPTAARMARAFVRRRWSHLENAATIDDVALCVSELVTNALDHAAPPFSLRISRRTALLRVEVDDGSAQKPVLRPISPSSPRGRGMFLVSQTATAWGVAPAAVGKTVWAEFETNGFG